MSKQSPLVREAKNIAKGIGISVVAWGDNTISFFDPKNEVKVKQLVSKLSLLGFTFAQDSADIEAGLLTFNTQSFKNYGIERKRTFGIRFIDILLIMGLLTTYLSFCSSHELYLAYDSNEWKVSDGKILSYDIRELSRRGVRHYKPVINYSYLDDDGKNHLSNKIRFVSEPRFGSSQDGISFLRSLEKDNKLKVYYNPQNPEMSILVTDIRIIDYFLPIIGFLSSLLFFWGWNRYRFGKLNKNNEK